LVPAIEPERSRTKATLTGGRVVFLAARFFGAVAWRRTYRVDRAPARTRERSVRAVKEVIGLCSGELLEPQCRPSL
jgi:hypothetical protein